MTWYVPWWMESASTTVGCRCSEEDGFAAASWSKAPDDTWVHACGMPSTATLRSQDLLNYFRYGPHHNEVIETEQLLKRPDVGRWIIEYAWTPETITGSESGRVARVWQHKESVST